MAAIDYLKEQGFSAKVSGSRLIVSPASKLTADVRKYVNAHKLEIIEALKAANDHLTPRQIGWLSATASILEVATDYLVDGGFIDSDDLEEQIESNPEQAAKLIRSDPRWLH